jgi:hypothetical protein
MMLFGSNTPMVLYHQTRKDRLAKIRRQGLKPHVPGEAWGVDKPVATKGKPVVWLTADPTTWRHARHHNKAKRDDGVLVTVIVNWQDPKLRHYISWRDPRKKWTFCENPNNPVAWFVYFGRIPPAAIVIPRLRRAKARRK